MTKTKRVMDIGLALLGIAVFALPAALIMLLLLACQGRPIFYGAERMMTADRPFQIWKFRTMLVCVNDSGVSGGDKSYRVTPVGQRLRRYRLDELPQLWNILRGDMSFVGPRPPLRVYVRQFPDLYAKVLQNRPGLTGLATLSFHRREAKLLSACTDARAVDAIYARRCVPRKAKLDLIYQERRTIWLDLRLLLQTVACLFSRN